MGTWGAGILDGDAPLGFLATLARGVLEDVAETRTRPPGEDSLGVVTGGVGLLLQLAPGLLAARGEEVAAAIRHHASQVGLLPEEARRVLGLVAEGRVGALTERDGTRTGPLLEALGGYVDHQAEPSLYVHPAARRYVERFSERCAGALDEGLLRTALDLQRAAAPLGALGALLIVRPASVEPARVDRWARALQAAEAASRVRSTGEELRLLEDAVHNLRLALKLAVRSPEGARGATPFAGTRALG